ncbi:MULTISPECIES: hypothetical protein [Streptomyces]|uniref:hypothetical protein n=1 Tax=Streptomyces TaxID=1883 RepID=UPI001E5E5953|nr:MULTISPECIES: hypothetical protein [Streptomyces]UFQ16726.1 hypothetical protein J2N69_17925 [Streptomyces huasconensis]WCL86326.1 hypothetical protein PPN52_17930 [Streptomyces sp. JCM 35825]
MPLASGLRTRLALSVGALVSTEADSGRGSGSPLPDVTRLDDGQKAALASVPARSTLGTLVVVEVGGMAAGLAAAELPLHRGEVAK